MQKVDGDMDISNKLQELTEHTLSFGDVIRCSEDPSDSNFREACDLFSQYLAYQLEIISSKIRFQDIRPEMRLTNAQLCILNELITPDFQSNQSDTANSHDWNTKVHGFYDQLQTLKKIAA